MRRDQAKRIGTLSEEEEEEEQVEKMASKKHDMNVEMVDNNPYSKLMALKNFKTF